MTELSREDVQGSIVEPVRDDDPAKDSAIREATLETVEVEGRRQFYRLQGRWSWWIITWISALIVFNAGLTVAVGLKWVEFENMQAVAGYATRLGEKLRRHGLATDHVTVFMHTSPFAEDEPQRNVSMTVDIPEATNDSLTLIKAARRAVDRLWQSGFRYSKAGIITQDLVPPPIPQRALFDNLDHERAAKVMAAMDEANRRWGRATVMPAATIGGPAKAQTFSTKFEMRSPRYTTRWDELPEAY